MKISKKLERLESWCNSNLKKHPEHTGLLETKEFVEIVKLIIVEKSKTNNDINTAINLISQIKIGNTLKYKDYQSNAIELLQNVLNNDVLKAD